MARRSRGRGAGPGRGRGEADDVPEIPGFTAAVTAFLAQLRAEMAGGPVGPQAAPHPAQPPREMNWLKAVSDTRVPTYAGEADPAALERYIVEHEKAFEALQVPAAHRIGIATFHLKDAASSWWRSVKDVHLALPDFTWAAYVELLRDKYYPLHLQQRQRQEFESLRQGGMTVDQYYTRFMGLLEYIPGVDYSERVRVQRFRSGLLYRIQTAMGATIYPTCQVCNQNYYHIE